MLIVKNRNCNDVSRQCFHPSFGISRNRYRKTSTVSASIDFFYYSNLNQSTPVFQERNKRRLLSCFETSTNISLSCLKERLRTLALSLNLTHVFSDIDIVITFEVLTIIYRVFGSHISQLWEIIENCYGYLMLVYFKKSWMRSWKQILFRSNCFHSRSFFCFQEFKLR